MCGIVGYLGQKNAWPLILEGLERLEYRGYDSSGIAILAQNGKLDIRRSSGKTRNLAQSQENNIPVGNIGIGHTRWATHGKPSVENSHPHTDCHHKLAVVHNGIVENFLALKRELSLEGHIFKSDTDTEVIAHLIEKGINKGMSFEESFRKMGTEIEGSQAIVAVKAGEVEPTILAMRLGNAGGLAISYEDGQAVVCSDIPAMLRFSNRATFLEDHEIAIITGSGIKYIDLNGAACNKQVITFNQTEQDIQKSGYDHFMLKEIMEQPVVMASTLRGRLDFESGLVALDELPFEAKDYATLQRVVLLGCGTSLLAATIGKYYIEEFTGLPVEVDSSSEFRYRNINVDKHTLVISISQSGETADTLAAMTAARDKGGRLLAISNIEGSQASRLAEGNLYMKAGLEIGVASTKTFTASLSILALLSIYIGQAKGHIDLQKSKEFAAEISSLPRQLGEVLSNHTKIQDIAKRFYAFDNFLYLGRNTGYPVAVEGALKLKEIAYIHAEGYPAGEMKHGPIALIDENMPIVAICTKGSTYAKMLGNIKELTARNGTIIAVINEGDQEIPSLVHECISIPNCSRLATPILATVPLQLLAYYIALNRGCDIDQPRSLAKSVTVE